MLHVASVCAPCCTLLDVVGCCCAKFETGLTFSPVQTDATLGPFIREKISRGLHKTRTPCINGTKSMFTAYSTQGQLKPRLILAEGFWDGLLQAAAYLERESVRINALKRCSRLAEAVNDCCACSVFNYIPDLHGRETRVAVVGK